MTDDKPQLRSITEIIKDLKKKIKPEHIKTKPAANNSSQKLKFIEWHTAIEYLDNYAPGWSSSVEFGPLMPMPPKLPNDKKQHRGKVYLTATISIPCSEGVVSRSATGMEDEVVTGFGDPSSNAESMAFRRAAAKFGLGLYLYRKET